ncbi:toxin-antitoxin system YwqK family antitoxin [Winogradskyella endarachnes]|uniref:Toxin-antitoxin system YwqK family antitoxin n=1 Tax=Winogradskyella endarachnes TaxID=2681965 RepID=A0A6L6U6R0_9FLAO|nr:hypothetical protein [Winogradskyella endarachnes]MUU77911.1 hypothetical protein [Winogradskyella endarachnes]
MILNFKKGFQFYMLFVFGLIQTLSAQQDTIYYDIGWKETIKDSAAFYRPPIKKEGDLYRIVDFYVSGQPQMSALSKNKDTAVFHGEVTWYNEDGSINQSGNYENNRLNGEFISFLGKKKLIAIYKNGYFIKGATNRGRGQSSFYTEIKNDTIIDIVYDGDINGIRYETYSLKKGRRFLSKYYNKKGELIAELNEADNGNRNGAEVFYYYQPMRVQQISYYPFGQYLGETFYYRNGQVRTKFEQKPEFKKSFYTLEGKELGSVTYTLDNGYLKPKAGTEYHFSYSYKAGREGVVISTKTFEDAKLIKYQLFYDNGILKSETTYNNNTKELQVSYNNKGEEIARIRYKNDYPYTGTEIIGDKTSTYKEGKLIKEVSYYPKTKMVFCEKTQEAETYFNKEGLIIGTLEIDYKNNYAKALNGKRFYPGYDTEFSSIETFKDGYLIERTNYRPKTLEDKTKQIYKRTEYYKSGTYDKIREVVYYNNGSKQSDITYKGYNKTLGKFYNEKEELIGTYDYTKKDGVLYEFFYESNVIQIRKEEKNGALIKLKKYDYGLNRSYNQINPVLIEEIDVTCCSKYYSKDGQLFAEAIYKDGLPWSGTIYDSSSRIKLDIKNGVKDGIYEKYSYNQNQILEKGQYVKNKKDGVFKTYNSRGELLNTKTYKNDLLNGEAIYYNDKGEIVSTLIFKDDKPFEGKKIINNSYNTTPTEETFSDGFITKKVSYDENGKCVSKYENGEEVESIAYYKDSNKKRLKYSVDKYYINGEVIRYDKSGTEQNKAIFKNNKLESGVVYLSGSIAYDNNVKYIILSKQTDKLTIKLIGHNDETIFFANQNLKKGYSVNYINKLGIYLDNISPKSLY